MPEYLAPSVFVEETSFRSKPLEGVSTSTTAFVGPALTGPLAVGTDASAGLEPELITSVNDFERIFGTTGALNHAGTGARLNHLAHAARAFFANGGRRLYVSRAFRYTDATSETTRLQDHARSADITDNGAGFTSRFVARFPGSSGNGLVELFEITTPASATAMARALPGSMARTGSASPGSGASREGVAGPFALTDGAQLSLDVSGATTTITFNGTAAEAAAGGVPAGTIAAPNNTLQVTLNGGPQTLVIPDGTYTPAELVSEINTRIVGGYARLEVGDVIVIGSDVRGTNSSVSVAQADDFGFTAPVVSPAGTGNVSNLASVTAGEIGALLSAASVPVTISETAGTRHIVMTTNAIGQAQTLQVVAPPLGPNANAALGFPSTQATGTNGSALTYYVKEGNQWNDVNGVALSLTPFPTIGVEFIGFTLVVTDQGGLSQNFDDLHLGAEHPRYVGSVLGSAPPRRADQLENRVALRTFGGPPVLPRTFAFNLRQGLFGSQSRASFTLTGGTDGLEPEAEDFRAALERLRSSEDISIVAAPGSPQFTAGGAIRAELISHVERRRAYEILVLDSPRDQTPNGARDDRAGIDSRYAAIYYPWVRVANPDVRPGDATTPREILVPPSGFVCGIYARNDVERGVFKAPANEVVLGALGFELNLSFGQQEILNPAGVNALRFFPGRGYRVWGARLASSDPEWKYVSDRRYFNYVEASIDRGTQWVVFEPNGPRLWRRVRDTIGDFLYNEWRSGALLGNTPAEAFFVRCDRSTMTQNDLDNGRLICEIGIAIIRPAEFVIFRIGQKTADSRS